MPINDKIMILVIGNKPYEKLKLNKLYDTFPKNIRLNMSLPNQNNGTIYNELALCNHLYQYLIQSNSNIKQFKEIYSKEYKDSSIDEYFKLRDYNKFNKIYLSITPKTEANQILYKIGCPYRFSKMPRTGYSVILKNLDKDLYITGFSIYDDERRTAYVKEGKFEGRSHNKNDEIKIIKWLHQNKKIDATLCLLEDQEEPTINGHNELLPSKIILDILKKREKNH